MTTARGAAADAEVVHALAAARALEADGQYNAAKLFRAAALAGAIRATRDHPGPGPEREQVMAGVIAAWRVARGEDALAAAMARALAAVRAGRPWVTRDEAPPTFVCRDCGEVLLGAPPAACPTCGARRLTFWEILPIHYLEPLAVEPLLAALEDGAAEVDRLGAGLGEEAAGRGGWPPREIVGHLIAAEQMLVGRARRLLADEDPFLASVPPPAPDAATPPAPFAHLIAGYRAGREQTLSLLRGLSPDQWERSGRHPEWGRITVREQASYLARHEQSHLAELEASRRAAEDAATGHDDR